MQAKMTKDWLCNDICRCLINKLHLLVYINAIEQTRWSKTLQVIDISELNVNMVRHPDSFKVYLYVSAVADPGFPRGGGGANSKGGVKRYYLANCFPKTAWNWKNLDPEGASSIRAPLDPPIISHGSHKCV